MNTIGKVVFHCPRSLLALRIKEVGKNETKKNYEGRGITFNLGSEINHSKNFSQKWTMILKSET